MMKNKLKGAVKGHSLLKRKSDALSARFRVLLGKIKEVSNSIIEEFIHYLLMRNL